MITKYSTGRWKRRCWRSRLRFSTLCLLLYGILLCGTAVGKLPTATPEQVGMRGPVLEQIDGLVQEGFDNKRMPGCVVMVGRHGKIVFHRAYGHRQLDPTPVKMEKDTVFDMASITKPVATATSVMILLEQGKIRLRDKVTTYIPEFGNSGKAPITVTQLLTHQAGFVPDNAVGDYEGGRQSAFEKIHNLDTMYDPGTRFVYSDVGFILLDDLIERQSGQNVAEFSKQHLFEPLGMHETGYLPDEPLRARAATTQEREGRWMQGEVHDPRAYLMGGVAGHAGLFSTAADLAIYAQMMLNGGHYGGKRILSKATVDLMTSEFPIMEENKISIRGLGWDKRTGYSSNRGENMSSRAFGHGGFTGTVLWIDPQHDLFFIFLSNRVHPDGKGYVNRLAGRMATMAVSAIDDELPLSHTDTHRSPVVTGIDQLKATNFERLAGLRVGLITNQTGMDGQGASTIKTLHEAENVTLTALFSPEHGIAGTLDQSMIRDGVDERSGLHVYSLYGESRKPTPEQLAEVDVLVFDIQDIGCRFYTYISTMGLAMQAAAENDKKFIVLDRPNPIGGVRVGGPLLDAGLESFVGFHTMPIQHGMTVGEIAQMLRAEMDGLQELDLQVVRCDRWSREQYFDETGLPWVNPSPNMRNLNEALLYPGIGVWETTNLSVGRGTDTPFEIVGAPWIDELELASALQQHGIPGVRFMPRRFTPNTSKYADQECGGVQIAITSRDAFDPIHCGIALAHSLRQLYEAEWEIDKSMRLLCNQEILDAIKQGASCEDVMALIARDVARFRVRRARHLLY